VELISIIFLWIFGLKEKKKLDAKKKKSTRVANYTKRRSSAK